MAQALSLSLLLSILAIGSCVAIEVTDHIDLWPMPTSVSHGTQRLYVSKGITMTMVGSTYSDEKEILKDAFQRTVDLIKLNHVVDGANPSSFVLTSVNVVVHSSEDELKFGVDESYNLSIPTAGNPLHAQIEARTVFGALHALQTFSQLCYFDFTSRLIEIISAPWTISDTPRFPYRGLLIDTSRHYLPVTVIKKVINTMTYSKLNVLHWHIVDAQSFPIEIPSYPKLWNGSYSFSERYTTSDAIDIVRYAENRGVNVMAEIDVPGHALSWGVGYPSLWPSDTCKEPLDVSNNFSFGVIDGILSDFSKVFKFKFVHLGGDEVNTSCWTATPHIKKWLDDNHMNVTDAYRYFVLRSQKIAISHGYDVINWEETFNNFGDKLDRRTVVHNWLDEDVAPKVVAAGLRCIVSNQDKWYLDHLDATWEGFYTNEPLKDIDNPDQQRLVIGGEVCMWGEQIDASDIEQTIWPRAAAAAERLWTPIEKIALDPRLVTPRLARFRCLLNQRGVAAAPLAGYGRTAPYEPGPCVRQ
ncbi:beta-hexosaminidase 3-like [Oryza brachyantha]|uniref:Beta-hexosaminidase n=1 Tax=Oryza brachyantha TaxID=4533 RepID=J3L6M5_ORYBR|nr:beta-hexosaminidase 3-like [Oryza brachyantha]